MLFHRDNLLPSEQCGSWVPESQDTLPDWSKCEPVHHQRSSLL
ncbi:mCG147336 [Mus musculus]|nr:mCG147336 [Mus musculus]